MPRPQVGWADGTGGLLHGGLALHGSSTLREHACMLPALTHPHTCDRAPIRPTPAASGGSFNSATSAFAVGAAGWAVGEELAHAGCGSREPSPQLPADFAHHPGAPQGAFAGPRAQPWGRGGGAMLSPFEQAHLQQLPQPALAGRSASSHAPDQPLQLQRHHHMQPHALDPIGPAPAGSSSSSQEPAGWYRSAVVHLEALLRQLDAPAGRADAAEAAARDLDAAVDALAARLARLAATDRAAAAALLCTNLETGATAAPADAHWRAVLAQLGLSPAQRQQALDCFAVYREQAAAGAGGKQALVQVGSTSGCCLHVHACMHAGFESQLELRIQMPEAWSMTPSNRSKPSPIGAPAAVPPAARRPPRPPGPRAGGRPRRPRVPGRHAALRAEPRPGRALVRILLPLLSIGRRHAGRLRARRLGAVRAPPGAGRRSGRLHHHQCGLGAFLSIRRRRTHHSRRPVGRWP